jgi:hypothetical protein
VRDLAAVLSEDSIVIADPGKPCPYRSAYYELIGDRGRLISIRPQGLAGEDPAHLRGALAAAVEHCGPTRLDIVVQPLHEAAARSPNGSLDEESSALTRR